MMLAGDSATSLLSGVDASDTIPDQPLHLYSLISLNLEHTFRRDLSVYLVNSIPMEQSPLLIGRIAVIRVSKLHMVSRFCMKRNAD